MRTVICFVENMLLDRKRIINPPVIVLGIDIICAVIIKIEYISSLDVIIYNNIQGTDVFDFYNNCTNDIYAQNNDWRVYDSLSIEQHVFHKADNSAHGLVKFIPFSNSIPVDITPLTATVYGNDVEIVWVTVTEKNNA